MRLRNVHVAVAVATLVAVLSCSGDNGTSPATAVEIAPRSDSTLLAGLIVSGPVADGFTSLDRSALSASVAPTAESSWVSLVPSTVADGVTATIINLRTTQRVTTPIVDGGFDPLQITAGLDDSLEITVSRGGKPDAAAFLRVGPRIAPRIVRTRPPRGQTDAPLNTVITIVFSEPVDPATVNATSVALSAAGSPVAGTVRVLPSPGYTVELEPSALLLPNTTYALTVSGVANFAGTPLAASTSITFTTSASVSSGSVASVTVTPDSVTMALGALGQLSVTRTDADGRFVLSPYQAVAWTSSAPDVASVNFWRGTLLAVAPGTVVITARSVSDGHTGTARITVSPATTPVGAIVSTVCDDYGTCGLYALDPNGSNGRFLTSSYGDRDPVWSPDGRSIAFRSDRGCNRSTTRICHNDLFVMRGDGTGIGADGSGLRSLTAGRGLDVGGVSWSPDGSRLVFAATVFPTDLLLGEELYVVNADGSRLQRLVSAPPGSSASWPDWSPDASRIAYEVVTLGDTSVINTVNADGSNAVRIKTLSRLNSDLRPRWSPDGKRIAFTRWSRAVDPYEPLSEVYVMNADGSNLTQITEESQWAWYPAWAPDGRSFAFISGAFRGLGVMSDDGIEGRSVPIPCCGFNVYSSLSWRRTAAAVPLSTTSSARP